MVRVVIARLGTTFDAGITDANPPNLFATALVGGILGASTLPTRCYYTVDNTYR